ncbi:hypothetical protein [Pelosinus sp. UFO1]|uniref:hypothetical protein n=1 Tax=Pelosinus sp. UFO1 TaxID=484770 RepID=UPI0004D0F365|nr:hypothetical protein [Pelosinus sp. UFO1]AIF51168.1 hypothetical protein UFO1_1617 [Pelosinus sp. UFO1]
MVVSYERVSNFNSELEQAYNILNERDSKIKTFIKIGFTADGFNHNLFTKIIEQSLGTSILIIDQISLIDDLLLYLQEKSFANITGKAIRETKSDGDNRPKFIYDGKLKYVEEKEEHNAL